MRKKTITIENVQKGAYEAPFYMRGSATYYTYQADRSVFAEFARSDGGTATLSYVSKPGNIGYDVPDALQSDGRLHVYFLQNHLGSPVVSFTTQIDAVRLQPKISQIRDYDAYGKEIFNVVYLHTAKPGFTGKELDAEGVSTEGLVGDVGVRGLGLNYFGKRFYDSEIGRWVGCDPKGQFFSSYAYAGNGHNPIGSTDPDGAKIRFDNNASPEFKAEFARAVRYLNKNNSSSILAKLEARSETITLRQGASLND